VCVLNLTVSLNNIMTNINILAPRTGLTLKKFYLSYALDINLYLTYLVCNNVLQKISAEIQIRNLLEMGTPTIYGSINASQNTNE